MTLLARRPLRLAAVIFLCLSGVAAAAQAQTTDPKTGLALGKETAPPPPPWQAAAQAAGNVGDTLPAAFGGVVVNATDQVADIYVVRGAGGVGDQIAKAAGKYARVHVVERSYASLIGTRDRITTDFDWIKGIGLEPITWGPSTRANGVFVTVPSFTPDQLKAVQERFGKFVELRETNERLEPMAGRWQDAPPYYSGDTITDVTNAATCTLGPVLRNPYSGNIYALTAAHCGPDGTFWYNNVPGQTQTNRYVGQQVLTNNKADPNDRYAGTDSALIRTNATYFQWSNSGRQIVLGTQTTRDGEGGLCVNGSLSGEQCGGTVVADESKDLCAYDGLAGGLVCGIFWFQRDRWVLGGSGDSGATIFSYYGNGVLVRGMLLGGASDHVIPCLYWYGGAFASRKCYDKMYGISIQRLEQNWYPSVTMRP